MNKKTVISFLIIVIVGSVGYFVFSKKPQQVITEQPISQNLPNAEQTAPITTTDWKTYRNDEYGFSLTFNDEWKGFKTEEIAGDDINTIVFQVPTSHVSYEGYVTALEIRVQPKNIWEKMQNEYQGGEYGHEFPDQFLAQNDKYVFTSITWVNISDLENINFGKVLSTFKFTK